MNKRKKEVASAKTESMEAAEAKEKKSIGSKRRKIQLLVMVLILVALITASFAWYLYSQKHESDAEAEVMTPYFLYLKNAQDNNSLEFAVGNLHPGEKKQVVICVTNQRPDNEQDNNNVEIARESQFYYDLEFAHTENLAVNYNIYELQKHDKDSSTTLPGGAIVLEGEDSAYWTKKGSVLSDYTDVSAERHKSEDVFGQEDVSDIWNAGRYLLYQYDTDGKPLQLQYTYSEDTTTFHYEYDYYLVEIEWKSGITFADYSKETDLVYVIVNAKQVEPTPETTP